MFAENSWKVLGLCAHFLSIYTDTLVNTFIYWHENAANSKRETRKVSEYIDLCGLSACSQKYLTHKVKMRPQFNFHQFKDLLPAFLFPDKRRRGNKNHKNMSVYSIKFAQGLNRNNSVSTLGTKQEKHVRRNSNGTAWITHHGLKQYNQYTVLQVPSSVIYYLVGERPRTKKEEEGVNITAFCVCVFFFPFLIC